MDETERTVQEAPHSLAAAAAVAVVAELAGLAEALAGEPVAEHVQTVARFVEELAEMWAEEGPGEPAEGAVAMLAAELAATPATEPAEAAVETIVEFPAGEAPLTDDQGYAEADAEEGGQARVAQEADGTRKTAGEVEAGIYWTERKLAG